MAGINVLAKAVYDNFAETGDELNFHRGDVVTVIEQNTAGLEGWWLCSFRGKQGIAPGNRLKIMAGMYGSGQGGAGTVAAQEQDVYDVPPSHSWNSPQKPLFVDQDEEYDIPRSQMKVGNNNPEPYSPTEIYDVPRASAWKHGYNNDDDQEVYDIPPSAVPVHSAQHNHVEDDQDVYNVPSSLMAFNNTPDPMELYDVPPLVSRGPQQTVFNPEEVYDVPPRRMEQVSSDLIDVQHPEEVYDIPSSLAFPISKTENVRSPMNRQESNESDVVYDIPQSNRAPGRRYIPSGLNSLRRMKREINALSTASTSNPVQPQAQQEQPDYIYDVPPQVSRDSNHNQQQQANPDDVVDGLLRRLSMNEPADNRANRLSQISKDSYNSFIDDNPLQFSELQLDFNTALEQLIELKRQLEDSVSSLLTMVKKNWRKRESIYGKTTDIQKLFLDVLKSLNQFLIFARGATANACNATNNHTEGKAPKNVQTGLRKLLNPVEEDAEMLRRAFSELDAAEWDIEKLALADDTDDGIALDEIDSFVMTSRAVSDDAAQMAVYIHTHAQYIFTKAKDLQRTSSPPVQPASPERPIQERNALQARPLPSVPNKNDSVASPSPTTVMPGEDAWLEDYDYVALEDKDDFEQSTQSPTSGNLAGLNKRRTQLLALEKDLSPSITRLEAGKISSKEKEALNELAIDIPELMQGLSNAIEQFTNAVEKGNQPHTFVALGKQVILCAHKLVFVGDCVHQQIRVQSVKDSIRDHCFDMCTALKHTVVSTKLAALQWPAIHAVQDMVDKIYDIAKCAHKIRLTLDHILY